jgi:murein DD-endopeptidase MepM/ murein hydrolase activator NlpD
MPVDLLAWLGENDTVLFARSVREGGCLNRSFVIVSAVALVVGGVLVSYLLHTQLTSSRQLAHQVQLARAEAAHIRQQAILTAETKLSRGENFATALQKVGLSAEDAASAAAVAQRAFNLRQLRAGNSLVANRSGEGTLREIDYKIAPDRLLRIVHTDHSFSAEIQEIPSTMEVANVSGKIEDSLFNAVAQAGESPELTLKLAQIFSYDLDFYTDPRKGDTFHVVLEKKKYGDGKTASYGRVLAAEYDNGGRKYQALLFHDEFGHPGYYTADGKALQKTFLRSPLKFAAPVTSHFSKARFHPILKVYRPHMGTDYGAPVGTPVQTIGSGRVVFAGRKGGEGNMVQISHTNGYETMYLHLSRMYVHDGEHVEIGKIIGLVGSSGLSTGPHLDFRIQQRGQFLNFEKLGLPPSDPISKKSWPEFAMVREHCLPLLQNPAPLTASVVPSIVPALR